MNYDWHVTLYKQHLARQYLGAKHVLHSKHTGGISHNPSEVNVSRTVKRAVKYAKLYDEAHAENALRNSQERREKVRQLGRNVK